MEEARRERQLWGTQIGLEVTMPLSLSTSPAPRPATTADERRKYGSFSSAALKPKKLGFDQPSPGDAKSGEEIFRPKCADQFHTVEKGVGHKRVLRKLVDDASKFLNDKVTKAVVTVPAYFNDSQRTATKDAGRIAGLEVLRIIKEPTAASLAYGFEKKNNETILVFDLGGGTFDVSVLEVGDGVFDVLSTSGDTHLGGDDFDKRIVDWLATNLKRDEGIDLLKDKQALLRLTETAEKAKMELSTLTQTNISLPFITATADGPKHIETTITRGKFEELCSDLLDSDLDEVILVGGSTRIPAVQELVRRLTGKEPNVMVNPDEVVALGAAVQVQKFDSRILWEIEYKVQVSLELALVSLFYACSSVFVIGSKKVMNRKEASFEYGNLQMKNRGYLNKMVALYIITFS
ncbi:hypothetical protein RHMOL_Rhmol05G0260600 [Rhododendron molle]|uniref:Uncharacterized protein n=1 Tax=Rhododendron molle TaxID=49168 RepID=A0ACC0NUH5_RHOML|nr:hypothetical protein RHMOL_Rhmol05G0260600 [Rhododendron molle]